MDMVKVKVTLRASFGRARQLFRSRSNPDSGAIHDDERTGEFICSDLTEESFESLLGFFDRGRPHSQPYDAMMVFRRKRPSIRKVFIVGNNEDAVALSPREDFFVGFSR